MCNKNQAVDILGEVYRSSGAIFQTALQDAYLYGSYARGDYSAESDVDILLTVDMDASRIAQYRRDMASLTSELSLKHNVTVSVTVKPLEQFRRYAQVLPYYQNVLKEGNRYAV